MTGGSEARGTGILPGGEDGLMPGGGAGLALCAGARLAGTVRAGEGGAPPLPMIVLITSPAVTAAVTVTTAAIEDQPGCLTAVLIAWPILLRQVPIAPRAPLQTSQPMRRRIRTSQVRLLRKFCTRARAGLIWR